MTANQQIITHYIAELYKAHYGWLYGWLYKKLGSAENAEDVLQDTFTKLIRSQGLLDIQQPKAYLTTTAKRILIDRARHQKIEQSYLEYLAQQNLTYDISPEQTVLAIDILNQLARVLDGLAERQQLAFLMHYIDGLSLVDIATRLKVTSRTIHYDLVKTLSHCYCVLKSDP